MCYRSAMRRHLAILAVLGALLAPPLPAAAQTSCRPTELGTVADSAEILDPQLSSYISDAGNHVTISVPRVG